MSVLFGLRRPGGGQLQGQELVSPGAAASCPPVSDSRAGSKLCFPALEEGHMSLTLERTSCFRVSATGYRAGSVPLVLTPGWCAQPLAHTGRPGDRFLLLSGEHTAETPGGLQGQFSALFFHSLDWKVQEDHLPNSGTGLWTSVPFTALQCSEFVNLGVRCFSSWA